MQRELEVYSNNRYSQKMTLLNQVSQNFLGYILEDPLY